jgi:hypothetical protein
MHKTSLTHTTDGSAGIQETTNKDPSINTFHQGLQHRDFSNTGQIGQVINPLNTLSDELSSISIHNIMSSRKSTTTKEPDQVMEEAQGTGQRNTAPKSGLKAPSMINAMINPSSTTEKIEKIHKSSATNEAEGVMKDAPQSTAQTSTTPKTNLQVSPMTGTTKKKTISSSKHATAGSTVRLRDQSAATTLDAVSTPSASSMINGSILNSNTTIQVSTPTVAAPTQRLTSTLSLVSTTTNKPPGPTFKPLKPIYDWVPPRPNIIARTEATDAEKEELRAEDAARKAEKKAEAERKEKEMEILMSGAKKCDGEKRAKDLAERIGSWD